MLVVRMMWVARLPQSSVCLVGPYFAASPFASQAGGAALKMDKKAPMLDHGEDGL
jgi:hypothetical protein